MLNPRTTTLKLCKLIDSLAIKEIEIDAEGKFRRKGFIDADCEKTIFEANNFMKQNPIISTATALKYYFSNPIRIYRLGKITLNLALDELADRMPKVY